MTEETLEGWAPEIGRGITLEEVIDRAFDYRGNVTVVKTDGTELEGRAARLTPPALVVSAGVCGALSPELRPGDLVVPDVVLGPAGERFATVEVAGLPRAGALAGVTDVVETPAAKARLWVQTRALACDMESAVILAWARARGIPAAVIRGVSDPADRGVPADLAAG